VNDLIAFLKARLDELAATASYAGPARIAWLTYRDDQGAMLYTTVAAGGDHAPWVADGHELPGPASARIVYDPARVLREVEAKRAIIERYKRAPAVSGSPVSFTRGQDEGYRQACMDAIRDLATIYGDHPDYRQEWAP